jgi:hypothetical protein
LKYGERAQKSTSSLAQKLLSLMELKKTNLALSADVTKKAGNSISIVSHLTRVVIACGKSWTAYLLA